MQGSSSGASQSRGCCGSVKSRKHHSSGSSQETQRLAPSDVSPKKSQRREKCLLGWAILGGVCTVGWLIAAIVGWVTVAAGRNGHVNILAPIALNRPEATFAIVVLGAGGGPYEDDVSGYMLRILHEANPKPWVALDGGAALGGVKAAVQNGVFSDVQIPASDQWMSLDRYIMQELTTHHLVGHTHLDHLLGLVTATAELTFQNVNHTLWGLDFVLAALSSSVFNNVLWPALQTFPGSGLSFSELLSFASTSLPGSGLNVTAFPLAHGDLNSTAFLLSTSQAELLYLSDVMPDACHWNAQRKACDVVSINRALWVAVAPLVIRHSLKAIMIESSYPSSRPDNLLFGHLTPCYVLQELRVLASLACATPVSCLAGTTVFITHNKGWWPNKAAAQEGSTLRTVMENEFKGSAVLRGTPGAANATSGCSSQHNDLGAEFIFVDRGFQYNV